MTREELHKYIQISMLLGNIDQETKSVEYNGLYFQEDSYGKIILTQCKGEYEFLNLGNLVDIIGPGVFYLNNTIRELEAPSVTIIKNGAFAYSPLEKINAPLVEKVDKYAFAECKGLHRVSFPKLSHIGVGGFANCFQMKRFNFSAIEYIDAFAFLNCYLIEEVHAPKLRHIDKNAFKGCSSIKTFKVGGIKNMWNLRRRVLLELRGAEIQHKK